MVKFGVGWCLGRLSDFWAYACALVAELPALLGGGLRQPQYHIAISHCYSGQVLAYQASVLCVCVRGHVGVSLIRLSMFVLLHALRSLKITLIGTPMRRKAAVCCIFIGFRIFQMSLIISYILETRCLPVIKDAAILSPAVRRGYEAVFLCSSQREILFFMSLPLSGMLGKLVQITRGM